jgi:AAHS family 4-hydroxybenzoate transporter-like MFS transporter
MAAPGPEQHEDSVSAVLDHAPVGAEHIRIFLVCAAIMTLDGFDLGVLGFVVPVIAAEWGLPPASFGFALSASLIGVAAGSAIAGWAGDRYGRRATLLWMFIIGAVGSLLTAFATDLTGLSIFRFITGFGMGGTIPNVIALVNEFSPRARRAFLVVVVYSMAAMGSVFASLLDGVLVHRFGWQSMFVVGGALPLMIGVLAYFALPESLRFTLARGGPSAGAARLLQRLSGRPPDDPLLQRALAGREAGPVAAAPLASSSMLFAGWLRWATPLLWLVFIGTQALVFFNSSWLPTLLRESGYTLEVAIRATGLFHFGSVVGGLAISWLASRYPLSRLLALLYLLAAISVTMLGSGIRGELAAYLIAFIMGCSVVGASFCLGAYASTCYPDALRARGVGWGLSVGRAGAIASPLLGGAALAAGYSVDSIISSLAVPALVCCAAMLLVARLQRSKPD